MTQRILVTGGGGFVGTQVLDELSRRRIEVHALGRHPPEQERRAGVVWQRVDLMADDPSPLLAAVRPTHCLHLAWEATPGRYREARENYDWVASTLRLARSFLDAGGRRFTMVGSCAEYALPAAVCDEATTPLASDCAYAVCKVETSRLLTSLARDSGGSFASGRIFYIYGPGEPNGKLIGSICRSLVRGQPIPLTSGADVVDFVFRSDVANALAALALSEVAGPVNIGTGQGVLVRDAAARLGEIAGRPDLLQFGKVPLGREPVRIVAATDRLTSDVGYRPAVDLDRGLRACYDFWAASKGKR